MADIAASTFVLQTVLPYICSVQKDTVYYSVLQVFVQYRWMEQIIHSIIQTPEELRLFRIGS